MKSKLIQEIKQPLLKRKEVVCDIEHAKAPTPKNEEVVKAVAEVTKAKEEVISVRKITNGFGSTNAEVRAFVYDSEDAKKAAEFIDKKKARQEAIKAAHEAKKKAAEEQPKEADVPKEEEKPAEAKEESNGKEASKE